MSIEDLIHEHLTTYNNHDIEGFMATMTEDIQAHFLQRETHLEGAEEVREIFNNLFTERDPEIKLGVRQVLVEGDQVVVVEQVLESSDESKIGKRAIVVNKLRDGKICEFWVH